MLSVSISFTISFVCVVTCVVEVTMGVKASRHQGVKASRCQGVKVSRFAISFACVVTIIAARSIQHAQVAFGVKASGCVVLDVQCFHSTKVCRTTGAIENG
jgi:hypothetical protein